MFLFSIRRCKDHTHLSSDLAGGGELAAALGAGQDVLAVLVELELGDDDVGGVDAEGHGLARGLVAGDALDVDDVFETIDGGDLALGALVGAADDGDLVVLADGDGADLWKRRLGGGVRWRGKRDMGGVRCTSHGAPWREGRS